MQRCRDVERCTKETGRERERDRERKNIGKEKEIPECVAIAMFKVLIAT